MTNAIGMLSPSLSSRRDRSGEIAGDGRGGRNDPERPAQLLPSNQHGGDGNDDGEDDDDDDTWLQHKLCIF